MWEKGQLVDTYCLMGEDVSGSLSPAMMNAAFEAAGIDAIYESISVEREEFRRRFLELREETSGMNLTIPYKSDVIPLLDELDEVSAEDRRRQRGQAVGVELPRLQHGRQRHHRPAEGARQGATRRGPAGRRRRARRGPSARP